MSEESIQSALEELRTRCKAAFEKAESEQALRDENAKILGKKGELTAILKLMGKVPAEARKAIGEQRQRAEDRGREGLRRAACARSSGGSARPSSTRRPST